MPLPHFDPQPVEFALERPVLMVVVDTEEEFDWARPFDRRSCSTRSIPAQDKAHAIYERLGVSPTYVMNYPVATDRAATSYFRRLVDRGAAEVGTHCHPWVTPPHEEQVTVYNSFHGNLPPELEAAKIVATTDAIAQAFGASPRIFKAGRYGVGPGTFETLRHLGYTLDCSFVPHTSFAFEGGPDFHGTPPSPFFTDGGRHLLEVPMTVGLTGSLASMGSALSPVFDATWTKALRLPGALNRSGLLRRVRLTPEGVQADAQMRLLDAMVEQGTRVFTLTYHSPSLVPGYTPYVRDEDDLRVFLERIESVLTYFRDRLGGEFTTLSAIERRARASEG